MTTDAVLDVQADVVVVGAGPTGLVSALLLARRGHQVALIERWSEPYGLPRAVGIVHETLRCLQAADAIEAVLPNLTISSDGSREMQICAADGEVLIARHDRATSPSGWPERAGFCQPEFERTLNQQAARHPNIRLLRGWNVHRVLDSGTEVVVEARRWPAAGTGADGAPAGLRARGRYVLGCDGANSAVRTGELAEFQDLGFSFDWLVVDVIPHDKRSYHPELGFIMGPPRPITSVGGGPGRRRWEFMRLDGETLDGLNRADTAWRLLEPFGVTPDNATLERHTVYSFRGRWSLTMRSGRTILAGDSAHLMPPFLGEGFNSGVRDALAAAWRLDLVLRGCVPDTVLDSYSTERIGHVRQIVRQAVELGRVLCITDPQQAAARDERLRAGSGGQSLSTNERGWRLGDGIWDPTDEHAGRLGVQGRVAVGGHTGLFDNLVGHGRFVLLGVDGDPGQQLSPGLRAAWTRIGGISAHVGVGAPVVDADGSYLKWFAELGAALILIRPDFYLFGTATSSAAASDLVSDLLGRLGVEH